jgi:SsrA-binding protein
MKSDNVKLISQNKKAYFDYFVIEQYEAGIELLGSEVKSLREGKVNLKDAWCSIEGQQLFLNNCHISEYKHGSYFNTDPLRVRRLLMHKNEILKMYGYIKQAGYSIIPLTMYFKDSLVKVKIGLCKGKKLYDKREDMARKTANREIERSVKSANSI